MRRQTPRPDEREHQLTPLTSSDPSPLQGGLIIPWKELSPEALTGIIEEFVTRDGTDYGEVEVCLEDKIARVRRQLESKKAVIAFDTASETCTILPAGHPSVRALKP